ncbi:MAG TPA: hypothetical protein VMB05_09155 [Solirubrobacteraceae bacterium]|nr:hypothetical protein [Solirubrobacteraceae bacterium]
MRPAQVGTYGDDTDERSLSQLRATKIGELQTGGKPRQARRSWSRRRPKRRSEETSTSQICPH